MRALGIGVRRSSNFELSAGELTFSLLASARARLRASIVLLGPLLARCGRAKVAAPGGDAIGSRGIDIHLDGLRRMGAKVTESTDFVEAETDGRLQGAEIELPYASVGATENLLMAAVTAQGTTRIGNAAREPEICDLAAYLIAAGARVIGKLFDRLAVMERWARRVTGVVFVLVGLYMILSYSFGLF